MNWIKKYMKITPVEEREGLELSPEDIMWEAAPTRFLATFLRCLPGLVPSDSVLYLEGYPDEALARFLTQHETKDITKLAVGTVWPQPEWHHLPVTPEVMEALAKFSETMDAPEIVTHLHVYRKQQILVAWHNAFEVPMYLSRALSDERVNKFCATVGIQYKRVSVQDL